MRRLALLLAALLILAGCSTTDFQTWEGHDSVIEGHGGTKKIVDGMAMWTNGDPPRRFRILGIIDDERPGGCDGLWHYDDGSTYEAYVEVRRDQISGMSAEWIYQTIATVTAAWRGIVRYLDGASSETDEQVHLCA